MWLVISSITPKPDQKLQIYSVDDKLKCWCNPSLLQMEPHAREGCYQKAAIPPQAPHAVLQMLAAAVKACRAAQVANSVKLLCSAVMMVVATNPYSQQPMKRTPARSVVE